MKFTYTQISSLNETEAHVYSYAIQNKDSVLEHSIRELANEIHVSTATILRFCKKMGCAGFLEFKYKLKESITVENLKKQIEDSSFADFAEHIETQNYSKSIQEAVNYIKNADDFYISFFGPYSDFAKFMSRSFSHIGYSCSAIVDKYYPIPKASEEGKSVVIIGYNQIVEKTIFDEVKRYKEQNCIVIMITAEDIGVLEHLCDVVIFISKGFVRTEQIISNIPLIYTFEKIQRELLK